MRLRDWLPRWPGILTAAVAGGLLSLAVAQPMLWVLQFAAIAWLAARVALLTPRRAAVLGQLFGWAWLGSSLWWLFISLHRYGGLPAWMAIVAVALLSGLMAVMLAAAMAAFARLRSGTVVHDVPLFAACWMLAELLRGTLFTGLPWAASGYAHVDSPMATLAPWLGVYGIGFVAAALAALVALTFLRNWRHGAMAAAGVLLALVAAQVLGPASFSRPTGTLSLALLQGNVPQDEKFSIAHLPEAMAWTRQQLLAADADLVLGPETVIPLLPEQLEPSYWQPLLAHFRAHGRAALIGLPLGDELRGYTNSVAGIAAGTATLDDGFYRYDKAHLVPFGEFIPSGFRWFTEMMNIPLGDFNRGTLAPPPFVVQGERIAPNICFEDLFGEELALRFRDPATAPTILANISNIGWFGETIAVRQHLNISRMRSLELQRPMLRATNTGATAVIDHRGVVTYALAPHTQGVLQASVQGRTGLTPFAWWAARLGLWLPAVMGLAIVAAAAWRPRFGGMRA